MPALIMDMRAIAATLRQHIRQDVVAFNREYNQTPCLVMLGFCDDQATIDLMGIMGHHSGEIGIRYWAQIFPTNIKESELRYHIERYNNDPSVHAISLQLPLPKQLNLEKISSYISVEKDVEGLHPTLLGRSLLGQSSLISPAALSITRLLSLYNIDPSGRHVVIVERNPESGSSLAGLLSQQSAIITLCPITTTNLRLHTRQAEILVTNVGQPDFIKADMVRPGAVVLDCGINYLNKSQIVGDVDFDPVANVAAAITPMPGGVGPLTVICLLENVIKAARFQAITQFSDNGSIVDSDSANLARTNHNLQEHEVKTTSLASRSDLRENTTPAVAVRTASQN